jgi:hypothetical protein
MASSLKGGSVPAGPREKTDPSILINRTSIAQ